MRKKGVSQISGILKPVAGQKYTYHITGWYPDTEAEKRNPKVVTWELFKQRKNGNFTSTNIKKKGFSEFTFGEKAVGSVYKLEAYLHAPEGGGLIIHPQPGKIPIINKVELFYVDDTTGSTFSFMEKLRAKAHCTNMFMKELTFTLWEDDVQGKGHNPNNKLILTKKAKVDINGVATAEFMLTRALMHKAMQGEADPKQLEFYVTAEYYAKKKHATENIHINNPLPPINGEIREDPTKTIPKAKDSPAEQKPPSMKEEKGIGDIAVDKAKELWDWLEAKGTVIREQIPTVQEPEGKSPAVVKETKPQKPGSNCGEKYCIKKGDQSELIREINIRLAGFGGNVPTDEFTDRTEKMIKQFQRDYMKVPETGKICGNVLQAIDEFQNKYIVHFDDIKCTCGKCTGFGRGKYLEHKQNNKIVEAYRKYEYPGIYRSLIWALRAVMFYTTNIEKDLKYTVRCIFSGYRCHEDNRKHRRTSTNHMGKALDLHFNKNGNRTKKIADIEEIRLKIFNKYLGAKWDWKVGQTDIFNLESTEKGATTWIHYDVREYNLTYLKNEYFADSLERANGKNIMEIAMTTHPNTCKCMGTGIGHSPSPTIVQKSQSNNFNIEDGKNALKKIYDKYGKDMAIIIEKMYRDETAHFTSGQYKACGTGGMEVHGDAPNYGWDNSFFEANPEYKAVGVWNAFENKGMSGKGGNKQVTDRKKEFVVLPSVLAGMEYKVFYINKHRGNWARWHSTEPKAQETYRKYLGDIKSRFVNEFEINK